MKSTALSCSICDVISFMAFFQRCWQSIVSTEQRPETATGEEEDEQQQNNAVLLNHVRCNIQQEWVSIEDAIECLQQLEHSSLLSTNGQRFPRSTVIKAMWPVTKHRDVKDDQRFDAIAFDNLYLLYGHDVGERELAIAKRFVGELVAAADYASGFRVSHLYYVIANAGKTAAQIRFERDVRERLLHANSYYEKKRKRDRTFRSKKKQHVQSNKIESNIETTFNWLEDSDNVNLGWIG